MSREDSYTYSSQFAKHAQALGFVYRPSRLGSRDMRPEMIARGFSQAIGHRAKNQPPLAQLISRYLTSQVGPRSLAAGSVGGNRGFSIVAARAEQKARVNAGIFDTSQPRIHLITVHKGDDASISHGFSPISKLPPRESSLGGQPLSYKRTGRTSNNPPSRYHLISGVVMHAVPSPQASLGLCLL